MKIACSLSAWKTSLEDALQRVARMGFAEVDIIAIKGWPHVDVARLADDYENYADEIERLVKGAGLRPVAMNAAIGATYDRSPETCSKRLEQARALARLMRRLGVKRTGFYPGYLLQDMEWDEALKNAKKTWDELHGIADEAEIEFLVEPHFNTPYQTIDEVTKLLDAIPKLHITYDPTHFEHQGFDLEQTRPFVERARHAHIRGVKKGKIHAPMEENTMDFEWVLRALYDAKYDGVISIEDLPGFDGDVEKDIAKVREAIEQVDRRIRS